MPKHNKDSNNNLITPQKRQSNQHNESSKNKSPRFGINPSAINIDLDLPTKTYEISSATTESQPNYLKTDFGHQFKPLSNSTSEDYFQLIFGFNRYVAERQLKGDSRVNTLIEHTIYEYALNKSPDFFEFMLKNLTNHGFRDIAYALSIDYQNINYYRDDNVVRSLVIDYETQQANCPTAATLQALAWLNNTVLRIWSDVTLEQNKLTPIHPLLHRVPLSAPERILDVCHSIPHPLDMDQSFKYTPLKAIVDPEQNKSYGIHQQAATPNNEVAHRGQSYSDYRNGAAYKSRFHGPNTFFSQPTQLGWNCFDIAVGLEQYYQIQHPDSAKRAQLARQYLVQDALKHMHNPDMRELLAPELETEFRRVGCDLETKQLQFPKDCQLPSSIVTEVIKANLVSYWQNDKQLNALVQQCNNQLRENGIELADRSFDGLNQYFHSLDNPQSMPKALDLFKRAYQAHEEANRCWENIEQYCRHPGVYANYISQYYGNDNWFALQPVASGESPSTSMVDITARIIGRNIQIIDQNSCLVHDTKLENYGYPNLYVQYNGAGHFSKMDLPQAQYKSGYPQFPSNPSNTM